MAGSSVIALPVQAPVVMIVTEVLSVRHVMEQGKRRINQMTVTIMSVIERIEKDSLHLFDTKGNWDTEAQDELLKLAKTGQQMQWISVNEKLPERPLYDWVLVAIKLVPENWYGVPRIAELRSGVWYCTECEPLEETLSVKVTHWMELPDNPKDGDNNG